MDIKLQFDSSAANAPSGWIAAVQTAADMLDSLIQNAINATIDVGYGEIEGSPLGANTLGEGAPSGAEVSYAQLVTALKAHPTSAIDQTFLNSLPSQNPGNGTMYFISDAQEQALGMLSATSSSIEGYVGFSTSAAFDYDPSNGVAGGKYDLVGDALHELSHALGRTMPFGLVTSMDLMAYGSNSQINVTNGAPRYLSLDGGKTPLANFDTKSDPGDFAAGSPVDPFDAALSTGTAYAWTAVDNDVMTALGYSTGAATGDPNFVMQDQSTGQGSYAQGSPYSGPVAGLATQYAVNTSHTLTVTAEVPNVFVELGYVPGTQTAPLMGGINVSMANGNNVLDCYANSAFLTGGTGNDTFYLDGRTLTQNSWSTVVNFHTGDAVTVWGVTPADFALDWIGDTYGAPGATGLTGVLRPATSGHPEIGFTLAGITDAALAKGAVTTSFGSIDGNNYLAVRAA